MLVLSQKVGEKIVIGDDIVIMVCDIQGGKVKLGIEAPSSIPVHREEVYKAIQVEGNGRERILKGGLGI